MIGLVGPSGSGKTTLVNLVCRFYDVAEGAMLVDGTDIRSFPIEEYRRHIGLVLQEPFLFYGTIAENIAYGRPDATRRGNHRRRPRRPRRRIHPPPAGRLRFARRRAGAIPLRRRAAADQHRPGAVDRPRILILDEATSSVDTETEREIQLALENLIRGRTTIAIAHRLSTLRRADRLVVIERGRIAETGRTTNCFAPTAPTPACIAPNPPPRRSMPNDRAAPTHRSRFHAPARRLGATCAGGRRRAKI